MKQKIILSVALAVSVMLSGTLAQAQNVGIGTNMPGEKLDVNGNVKASGIQITTNPGSGKILVSDANGFGTWQTGPVGPAGANGISIQWLGPLVVAPAAPTLNQAYYNTTTLGSYIWDGVSWQILALDGVAGAPGPVGPAGPAGPPGATGPAGAANMTGTTNYLVKFTGATTGGNSLMRDDGTNLSFGAVTSANYGLYGYKTQLTATGDGQSTIYGYRTRDVQNDGTTYGATGVNSAVAGYNFWGDVYTFGSVGHSWNDYTRTGGVMGAYYSGTYWGSLGYKSSASATYGVYGSAAYANGAGQLPTKEINGIGGGFFGAIGSVSKGSVIGQLNEGELFAAYNLGDVYTMGKQIELVNVNEQVIPSYTSTSLEATVYAKGKIQMQHGQAFVRFDENYTSLLGEAPVVTVSPMGACNGVYISEVSEEGFMIQEQNGGTHSVEISWISVGNRIDAKETEVPSMLTQSSFKRNLSQALFNDGNKKQSGKGMWWNGKELQFGEMPASLNPKMDEATKKAMEQKAVK